MHHYSKRELKDASRVLAGAIPYPYPAEAIEAFRMAHEWRVSHFDAMRTVRAELRAKANRFGSGCPVTAGRLKRIASIRKKLKRTPLSLYDIQDIGGCRAIVGSMADVEKLTSFYLTDGSEHGTPRLYDHILSPKLTGYRSRHFVLSVAPSSDHMRRRIEVQVRTELQHAWATTVEAVGLVRNEDLKADRGSPEWLRLFALMASELAVIEDCPIVPGVPANSAERREELRDLDRRLKAVATLESYNQTIAKIADTRNLRGSSFLVRLDLDKRIVDVRSNYSMVAAEALLAAETSSLLTNAVIIEVDRVADLLAAYPNYYLDVRQFTDYLRRIVTVPVARPQATIGPGPDPKRARPRKWGNLEELGDYLRVYHQRKR